MAARALLLLLAAGLQAHGGVLTAKEYICKDPDTGTLHTLNSTWHSTTFCGNYTCKLRKANKTRTQPTSTIIVNLTLPEARNPSNNDKESINNEHHNGKDFTLSKILSELTMDNDRLLNKDEIQKISEILPTVKKSDLQAIIELYSVAQEIYSGMNSDSPGKSRASETELQDLTKTGDKKSYWYEPMSGYRKESAIDMKSEGSEFKQTVTHPARSPYEYFYAQRPSSYSYFSGTLLNSNDFGRIGYNNGANPGWQSYYQQKGTYDASRSIPTNPCTPCPTGQYQYQTPFTTNTASRPHYSPPHRSTDNMLQPYYYNISQHYANYANNYYKGNPWAYYDYYRNYPYSTTPQFQRNPYPNAINAGSPSLQQKNTDENNVNSKEQDDKPWKTDPLSDEVLNEIKANVAHGKLLNIPLKKRIKLERAAKVIKLDSFKNRQTRSISSEVNSKENNTDIGETQQKTEEQNDSTIEEEMETYIEKVTCPHTEEPGYFRLGNLTQPFPACCPQKIEDKQR